MSSSHTDRRTDEWFRSAVVAVTSVFPFVIFPGISAPFSTPKIVLLSVFVLVTGISVLIVRVFAASTGRFRLPHLPRCFGLSLAAWTGSIALSALFGEFVSPEALGLSVFTVAWFCLVLAVKPKAEHVAASIAASSALLAVIGLLQYAGWDPFFSLFGWTTPAYGSPRMRVFATLGNPNFVAAFLVGSIPVLIGTLRRIKWRGLSLVLIVLEIAALFATGSRAAIVGLTAALVWLIALGRSRWSSHWKVLLAGAVVLTVLLPLMPSRSLATTLAGRLYIWRVTAPHLLERPLFGFGPRAFEPKYIEWETEYWRDGKGSAELKRFSELQTHAHNDYLEVMVNNGFAGSLSLLFLLGALIHMVWKRAGEKPSALDVAASAGIVALAGVALVDFPLHRPAELFLFWTLAAIVFLTNREAESLDP